MKITKPLWIGIAFIAMGFGALGVPLPILPTTPFLLLAAFCFAKGSDRLNNWFRATKLYKRHLESFVQNRAMTLKTKLCILIPASIMLVFAFIGMSRKDTVGTRIGRTVILILIAVKYIYFFTKIKNLDAKRWDAKPSARIKTVRQNEIKVVSQNTVPNEQVKDAYGETRA
ncbi:MAG: YbaN family protein [Treponema sp.]|nr:YbaN family protein [Treponema sp.]